MKLYLLLAILLLSSLPSMASADQCAAGGAVLHWSVDYCLYLAETDDFENEAVQSCLEKEQAFQLDNTCENRMLYKRKLCSMPAVSKAFSSVDACVEDEAFSGPTVRNGGV